MKQKLFQHQVAKLDLQVPYGVIGVITWSKIAIVGVRISHFGIKFENF